MRRLSAPIWRILLANLAPPFVSSAVLLYVTELKNRSVVSLPVAGLALSCAAAASFVGPLFMGALARRLGHHCVGWIGLAVMAAGLVALGATVNTPALLTAMLALGLGYSAIVVMGSAELAGRLPRHTHSIIALQYAATALGGIGAGPFSAWLLHAYPVTATPGPSHWLAAVCLVLCALAILPSLLLRDYSGRPRFVNRQPLCLNLAWGILLLACLHGMCDVGTWNWMPIWLQDRSAAAQGLVATLMSLTWLASFIGRGLTIVLANRFGPSVARRCAATGAAAGIVITWLTHSPWGMILAYSLYCLWAAGNLPGLLALVSERCPDQRAEMTGLTVSTINGAGAFSAFIFSRLAVHTGQASSGLPVGAAAMVVFAVLVWLGFAGTAFLRQDGCTPR